MTVSLLIAVALAGSNVPLPPGLPLYCVDSTAAYQPIKRTSLGGLQSAFARRLGFMGSLKQSSSTSGSLTFSKGNPAFDSVVYDVEPHDTGVALLSMRVRNRGKLTAFFGNEMCWKTFDIIFGK